MQNTDMLKQLILENQFISFDIFDTLINRFVQERRQVFALVELAANENGFVINNFIEKRINAEKLAHKKTSLEEITLDEIYNILAIEYGANIASVVKKLEEDISYFAYMFQKDAYLSSNVDVLKQDINLHLS